METTNVNATFFGKSVSPRRYFLQVSSYGPRRIGDSLFNGRSHTWTEARQNTLKAKYPSLGRSTLGKLLRVANQGLELPNIHWIEM